MGTKIAIIGAGRVGTGLGVLLSRKGYRITGIADVERSRAEACVRRIAAEGGEDDLARPVTTDPCRAAADADIIFVTTPDRELSGVARRLARCPASPSKPGLRAGAVLCQTSGALPSSVLRAEGLEALSVLSLHPLMSFADRETAPERLAGAICVLEGDRDALPAGERIVHDLGGRAISIEAQDKMIYHAAACTASNYLVTLLHLARLLLARIGIDGDAATEMLLPLARSTLDNIESVGTPEALTGPIERGDVAILEAHLAALEEGEETGATAAYALLGMITAALASEKGTIGPNGRRQLEDLFSTALSASLSRRESRGSGPDRPQRGGSGQERRSRADD
jgi:predicted short-subunit dehydrogenase-like oxidoreductase (DUF2520 family)